MRRFTTILFVLIAVFSLGAPTVALAQSEGSEEPKTTFERARVLETQKKQGNADTALVKMLTGPEKDKQMTISVGSLTTSLDLTPPSYEKGDVVLVSRQSVPNDKPQYVLLDHYRLSFALWLLIAILVIAVLFAGIRGIGSIFGLILSIPVIGFFIVPQIINGGSPYLATAIGIMVISGIGIFVAHGFSRRTGLALISTYLTLILAVLLSTLTIVGMNLSGMSSENIFHLNQIKPDLNLQGLLLCGTIISLIGVLDDITVGQATAVQELHYANPKLTTAELYNRGIKIGREHIASLINTLVLVYVGTSFTFIVYLAAISPFPMLVNLNSELIMEEIARSLVGSAALILAVPLTTYLSARFLRNELKPGEAAHSGHAH